MIHHPDALSPVKNAHCCRSSWDAMSGTERVRFCEECGLHVYHLSGLTRPEAEAVVQQVEGRTGLRYYRRKDGTWLTQDCPVGRQAFRRKAALTVGLAVATAIYILSQVVTSFRGTRGREEEAPSHYRNRLFANVLHLIDPVPPFKPSPPVLGPPNCDW